VLVHREEPDERDLAVLRHGRQIVRLARGRPRWVRAASCAPAADHRGLAGRCRRCRVGHRFAIAGRARRSILIDGWRRRREKSVSSSATSTSPFASLQRSRR
jgi:hypothetical protein